MDVESEQVGDLVLFRAADPTDRLSVGNTRKMANPIFASTGAVLWSTTYRQLARIELDTVGRHDLIASACTPYTTTRSDSATVASVTARASTISPRPSSRGISPSLRFLIP